VTSIWALIDKAEAVALRPGDTLVLHYREHLSASEAAAIRERAEAALPDNKVVVVRADAVRVESEERPEHAACRRPS
jgi:hypothetical protein